MLAISAAPPQGKTIRRLTPPALWGDMRSRLLVLAALLALPSVLSAQILRIPRIGRGTPPPVAPLPPEAEPVARSLAYKRSRWSAEGYSMINAARVPATSGAITSYTTAGTGTHADYRYTDHLSATIDLTASMLGDPAITETGELGTRLRLLSLEETIRPFVDLRAGYMHMQNTSTATQTSIVLGAPNQQLGGENRYSRGFGSMAGAGFEMALTRTIAVTTEAATLRNRMTTYRLSTRSSPPPANTYWMTSYRFILGLKYNPVRPVNAKQKGD
jgi:hypothetical protein